MASNKTKKQVNSKANSKNKQQADQPDYANMKKTEIPCGHYFKWVDFHSQKLKVQLKKVKNDKKSVGKKVKKLKKWEHHG